MARVPLPLEEVRREMAPACPCCGGPVKDDGRTAAILWPSRAQANSTFGNTGLIGTCVDPVAPEQEDTE